MVDFTYTNSWIFTNSNKKERTILWQIWTAVIYYLYGISWILIINKATLDGKGTCKI